MRVVVHNRAQSLLLALLLVLLPGCSLGAAPTPTTAPTPTAAPDLAETPTALATESIAAVAPKPAGAPTATATRATPATVARATPTATGAAGPMVTPWGSPLPALATGQPYKDPQNRFAFTIPGNWTQAQAAGAEVAFQSPLPPSGPPAAVNVVLDDLPGSSVTLDEYDKAAEANLKQQFTDYKLISLTKVSVDGRPAYKRVFSATIANGLLQIQQVYLIDKNKAYIISCGAPQTTFANYTAVFEQIAGTFKLGTP